MIRPPWSTIRSMVVAATLCAAVAACSAAPGTTARPSPACTPGGSASGCATPSVVASSPAVSPPPTTTTEWGVIWDGLPPSFPAYPGAQATETRAGPASAVLQVRATVEVAADFYREALEAAGYRIEAVNGPLEDGSIVIDAVGSGACRIQAAIAPLGGVTVATIFLGAECPFR